MIIRVRQSLVRRHHAALEAGGCELEAGGVRQRRCEHARRGGGAGPRRSCRNEPEAEGFAAVRAGSSRSSLSSDDGEQHRMPPPAQPAAPAQPGIKPPLVHPFI